MIEVSANGVSITPLLGVKALRHGGNRATFVAVPPEQLEEIRALFKTVPVPSHVTFMALPVRVDHHMVKDELHFRDGENMTVAKITGLGRSRAIPVEELKRG